MLFELCNAMNALLRDISMIENVNTYIFVIVERCSLVESMQYEHMFLRGVHNSSAPSWSPCSREPLQTHYNKIS